jgi:glucose/arabinose dehydrogenase
MAILARIGPIASMMRLSDVRHPRGEILRPISRALTALVGATTVVFATMVAGAVPSSAATLPPPNLPAGFTQTQLAGGLSKPIALAFAPNGDLYIAEQAGTILIDRGGTILSTPLATLPNVYSSGECGLLGMALDPNYTTNGYIYISYVVNVTNSAGVTQPFSRLSRFTVSGDVLNTATEKVYYQGNQTQNQHHAGNDLKVGPDGKLWWSVGDNVPSITNAQALTNIYGKMLRFNLDGSIPADNPFLNVPGAIPAIYSYGLRNPWRFTFLPDGRTMTADTGSSYAEELDTLQPGGNYGWDFVEGDAYSTGYIAPAYSYGHVPTDGAISSLQAYSGSTFGPAYAHTVFFGDYNRQDIEAVDFDPTYSTETSDTVFDQAAGTIADLIEGPDGNLYFASIFEGTVNEISTTGTPTATPNPYVPPQPAAGAPTVNVSGPSTYNAGDTVNFTGTATDPTDGTEPASAYTWQIDYYRDGVLKPFYSLEVPGPVGGPTNGATSFSYTIPADTSQTPNSFYRVTLSVKDSTGSTTVVTKDLTPNTATLSTNSAVPGAGYFVDGTWHTGPFSETGVVGVKHVLIGQPLAQSVGGNSYRFSGWSDGSALWDQLNPAERLERHRRRRPDHRRDHRLQRRDRHLLHERRRRRCLQQQRPGAARLSDAERRRLHHGAGALPVGVQPVGQGRRDHPAEHHLGRTLRGHAGHSGRQQRHPGHQRGELHDERLRQPAAADQPVHHRLRPADAVHRAGIEDPAERHRAADRPEQVGAAGALRQHLHLVSVA